MFFMTKKILNVDISEFGTLHVTEMRQEVVKKIVKEKKIVKSKIDIYIFHKYIYACAYFIYLYI